MKSTIAFYMVSAVAAGVIGGKSWIRAAEDSGHYNKTSTSHKIDTKQVPTWSEQDMDFFLHGSMSTEVIPETVLRAFIKTYPDLFPTQDLSHLGLIPDPEFGWPIGFSRRPEVKHLGGLSAVGINCASCHVAQFTLASENKPLRILGSTSHFDVEAFFGSVLVATFKTSDPANMKKFVSAYLSVTHPKVTQMRSNFLQRHGSDRNRKSPLQSLRTRSVLRILSQVICIRSFPGRCRWTLNFWIAMSILRRSRIRW